MRDRKATPLTHRRELMDLAALHLEDPILAHRVLSEGRLVCDADPERRVDFTSDVLGRYLDWAPRYEAAASRSAEANRAWAREALH